MTPEEEAYEEVLHRIRETETTRAHALDLDRSGHRIRPARLPELTRLPPESETPHFPPIIRSETE